MITNAQAALIAAATIYSGEDVPRETILLEASELKRSLDLQDTADRRAKDQVVKDRDLHTVTKAFGKTPKPDNVIVMAPGQLYPTATQLVDAPTPDTNFITYQQALAQGWTDERAL